MENSADMEAVVGILDLLTLTAADILEKKILGSSAKQAHSFQLHWQKLAWNYHCCERGAERRSGGVGCLEKSEVKDKVFSV